MCVSSDMRKRPFIELMWRESIHLWESAPKSSHSSLCPQCQTRVSSPRRDSARASVVGWQGAAERGVTEGHRLGGLERPVGCEGTAKWSGYNSFFSNVP